ncbi:CCR4-NOT regulatory complex component [Ceratobasidium sp. 392]|nr:CCR4-NOT regulatory complex component [Ceratobasidium sp. 392]
MTTPSAVAATENAIDVKGLSYAHTTHENIHPALLDLSLSLPKGSRTLLIGANGAGKSTLLQILAGRRLVRGNDVRILGRDVFRDSPPGVTFLGTEWAMNPVVRSDIVVSHFLDSVGGYRHKARRDRLLDILDVDLDWHMHAISDGERRRVQLVMGLMAEWDVLLLDEVTVDLDVLVRDDLLSFLKEESETRGATILYATHIFDGLNNFPTHVAHMRFGSFVTEPAPWLQDQTQAALPSSSGSTLHALALQWLKEDRTFRQQEEAAGRLSKTRGAKEDTGVPTDSEAFYKKYDYSH